MSERMSKEKIAYIVNLKLTKTTEELERARAMGLHSVIAQLSGKQQAYREMLSLLQGSTALAQLTYYEGFTQAL